MSTDPALMEYIPGAPVNDDIKKSNQNLPGMGGAFNIVNFHLYHYAGNNPVKYTDPDGRKQTPGQVAMTEFLSSKNDKNILKDVTITIKRSYLDNGKNGQYYKSTLSVSYKGVQLNSVPVQSTADNPQEIDDFTLPAGEYTGKLKEASGSYLNAILIFSDDFLIHPDEITVPDRKAKRLAEGKNNGPFSGPLSAGCQILKLKDFNELIQILGDLGFKPEDNIKVEIIDPDAWKYYKGRGEAQ